MEQAKGYYFYLQYASSMPAITVYNVGSKENIGPFFRKQGYLVK